MSLFEAFFIFVYTTNITLGISVFVTNNKRSVNQHFLTLCAITTVWLTSNWLILTADTSDKAVFYVRLATSTAILIPTACHILRLAILHPNKSWLKIIFMAKRLLGLCFLIAALCFTPFFIDSVNMPSAAPDSPAFPEPAYNWGYFIFALSFIALVGSLLASYFQDRKQAEGLQRVELDFIAIGYSAALITGTLCGVMVTVFTGSSQTVPVANTTSILTLSSVIAYGIATKRILGIATILRRIAAYSILVIYLALVYLLVWHSSRVLFMYLNIETILPSQILATLVVALTMAPVHGKLQRFSNKLIVSKALNISGTIKKANDIFRSVTTQNALLSHFSRLLLDALDAEHVTILLPEHAGYLQHFPKPANNPALIPYDSAVISLINKHGDPVCRDHLARSRETATTKRADQSLERHHSNIAIGVLSKSSLIGIVLLGPRISGRIYDKAEQDALQILCNQFAVALENAQMYTEMQDSKIRNELLLDQLVSGVVVASPDRKITLINHEAQRITRLTEEQSIGKDIDLLPPALSRALDGTLIAQLELQNISEALLSPGDEVTHVRMGSAHIIGHDNKSMGALLVFTDMTELKKLEEQVRRADQLSSVGTLAAGMAHEIKNPLVTIKTFTQLLPERHADEDFRKDFSQLVAHEVSRIDGIVNQLLSFSKPTQPHLARMNLHATVEQTLKLIQEQVSQKRIELNDSLKAKNDLISGDADLLTQALVNLNLNAIDAIDEGGAIHVKTTNCSYSFAQDDSPDKAVKRQCIRLQITDTGVGIEHDKLNKIFDPFFTSKSEGTGMGLSVAHGIVQEHHGVIEVESRIGKGTTFSIYLPLLKEDAAA